MKPRGSCRFDVVLGERSYRDAVGVDRQRFANTQVLHHDETETVDEAIGLIVVPFEIVERLALLFGHRPVNARQLLVVQLLSEFRGFGVSGPPRERDRQTRRPGNTSPGPSRLPLTIEL